MYNSGYTGPKSIQIHLLSEIKQEDIIQLHKWHKNED